MTTLAIHRAPGTQAIVLPEPRSPISIRPAVASDFAFIDSLQKKHTRMVGWFPTKQLVKYIAAARELRDRYLEEVNTARLLPGAHGKYDVSRQLEAAPSTLKQVPLLNAA